MANYLGKKIVIVGLGKTGLSCVNFFISKKIFPKVIDTHNSPTLKSFIPKGISCHFGSWNQEWIISSDLIILSPGVDRFQTEIQLAYKKGIEIIGDVELFCRELKKDKKIISITGSNGKSTTTCLLMEIARKAGLKVGVGGNIGNPVLDLLRYDYDVYILELSSFQLETTNTLQSYGAVILNVSENHMDRYPLGMDQYISAKLKIYEFAKICVVNVMDSTIWPIHRESHNRDYLSFGMNSGIYSLNTRKNIIQRYGETLIHTKSIKISGTHNYFNFLAALCLAEIINIPIRTSISVISKYRGLPHRLQVIHKKDGVTWINDSKSTNINSTIAAIKSIEKARKIHLLLGGDRKMSKLSPLKRFICFREDIQIYCFGKDKLKFGKLKDNSIVLDTLKQCVLKVLEISKNGDVVLLSPACSSLDQFLNFEHRGEIFTKMVKNFCS
ncbi:UDP-N-acetylmuramoyl-L-alanine--D-glutamate ligase [Candidatus Riesia pediculischaeffi]|uniref:UDP-N-acetylmuramoylalanine--D-glutamate ligase n=2 Tax=Candidatus Riesia pediculischaeffi TaxID=428411 RepID=A0A1V0HK26_9ENTR|nr:UDP-N-acetylmuramoyl-L-alanine--D-glutamate ligase [Candidatus Riesia pediculischaeffi]ARC53187.1 hypothetical protein AOQ87_00520 [Candidatus Riesia pediculischaeffi]KIE64179.1 UDP-N-acetylmuramoylalanine--D-glutamate ligase [Candidatus Riesia pediculischaeffi PTSU]